VSLIAVNGGEHGMAEINGDGDVVYTPNAEFFGPTRITYTLSDGRNGNSTAQIDLRVRPVAEARDDTGFVMDEDDFLTIDAARLLSNDLNGDRMIVAQVFGFENGSASLASNGQVTFTPDANFSGTGAFTYVANTPEGGRAEARVTIQVTAVNDAPVARNDGGFVTLEDVPFDISTGALLANDTDVDGDTLSITSVTSNANIAVTLTDDGLIQITPRDFFWGGGYFDYTISDGQGGTATARASISVTPVNNAPEPVLDQVTTDEDNPIIINTAFMVANDIDRDEDVLTVTSISNDFGGVAELLDNGIVLFEPWANFNGMAYYDYRVTDGQCGGGEGRVEITVNAVNDRPNARDDNYQSSALMNVLNGTEDIPLEISIAELMKNDSDVEGLGLTFENVSEAVDGTIEITDRGTLIFTPEADFWGATTFNYLVADPEGAVDDAMVTLFFENVSDAPPVAVTDLISVFEDVPTIIPQAVLLANDFDIDRDPLTINGWRLPSFSESFADPVTGMFERLENGDFLYTPALNETRENGFFYRVTDGTDQDPNFGVGYVDITIIPVNDQPTAVPDTVVSGPLDVPLIIRISDLMSNDFDVDDRPEGPFSISFVGVDSISVGTYEIRGDFIVVQLPQGYTGPVELQYRITDTEGVQDTTIVTSLTEAGYNGVLTGTPRPDLLIGNWMDETISGRDSDDLIEANAGADVIDGEIGDDTIFAGAGDDTIDGGEGGDSIEGGDGYDWLTHANSLVGVRMDLGVRLGQGGTAAGDVVSGVEAMIGSDWNDTLGGSLAYNVIEGGTGRDLIEGKDGIDTLRGEDGNDTLVGGADADLLGGGDGSDTADYRGSAEAVRVSLADGTATGGDAEGDTLFSIENLAGSDFADVLTGNADANDLDGGRGDDLIRGLAGDDILSGGRGADTIEGGAGIDIATYATSATGVSVDMANGAAGDGDATGDVFDSIEIVQGSFHDDSIAGDAGDNILRGGRGADDLDGREGIDTADYSVADEGVAVDLGTGQGTAGEALGDTLSNIEVLRGSVWEDSLTGSAGDDTLDGNWGDDLMAGAAGSDGYIFGYDSGNNQVIEAGAAIDIDRVLINADIAPKDLSVIREGDDLLLELERDEGFLIDTLRVTDHFLDAERGIEQVVFADGTIWDRDQIDALQRVGRFNAQDDIYRLAIEDVVAIIDPADLIENDLSEEADAVGIELIGVGNAVNGTVSLLGDGTISWLGDENFNGDGFFEYTLRDQFGRETSARVEVNVAPVNDAPEGADDGVFTGTEDTLLRISYADLIGNDFDVDGDPMTVIEISPLFDEDGNALYPATPRPADFPLSESGTFGVAGRDGLFVTFKPVPDHFGFAGFTYTLADPDGATSTAAVELFFLPVNDAPRSRDDAQVIRLERTTDITVSKLLSNDFDVEGDAFDIEGVHSEFGGTLVYDDASGIISFTPDALGLAGFSYDLVDARGARSTIQVPITVIPLNDPPIARDDGGFITLEDTVLVIDPADLLANDTDNTDPIDDVITLSGLDRFAENGRVALNADGLIEFTPRSDYNGDAGFLYQITDGNGGFDTAYVSLTILPSNDGPTLRDDIALGIEDEPIVVIPGEVFGNDSDPEGDVIFFDQVSFLGAITDDYSSREAVSISLGCAMDKLAEDVTATALVGGAALPAGILFDAETLTLSGTLPDGTDTLDVTLTLARPGGSEFTETLTLDGTSDLTNGVTWQPNVALFDISEGTFSVRPAGNQPLPNWLEFNAETRELTKVGTAPVDDTDPLRVQLRFEPPLETLAADTFQHGNRGFALEVLIDPQADLPGSIAELLAGDPFFEGQDLFAVDLGTGTATALTENNGPLAEWMGFDADTLTFDGTPPPIFVGTPPVRVVVAGGAQDFSLLTELPIDATYSVESLDGLVGQVFSDRFNSTTPEDFNGQVVLRYTAADEKGGVSDAAAQIVVNVLAQPETPDAGEDMVTATENVVQTIALADLLANDVDDDGDPIRAIEVDQPADGTIEVQLSNLTLLPGALVLAGGVYSAALADGSDLPTWLVLDPATGEMTGDVPLDATGPLSITLSVSDGTTSDSATIDTVLDGNDGVMLLYTPDADFSGADSFSYVITDDAQGTGTGRVTINVAAVNDPPVANPDNVAVNEDSFVVIAPATLLANDSDPEGDTLIVTSVFERFFVIGQGLREVALAEQPDGTFVYNPPRDDFGSATLLHRVSDGGGIPVEGQILIDLLPTPDAPEARDDEFDGTEDTVLTILESQILANDRDPDFDALTLVQIQGENGVSVVRDGLGRLIVQGNRVWDRPAQAGSKAIES